MTKYFTYMLLLSFFILSCKKKNEIDFNNTHWNTKFRFDGFTFFAEKELQLNADKTCLDIGMVDTTYGTWSSDTKKIYITLQDNTTIEARIITQDSLSGFRTNNSVTGQWLATKQ
ncbi:MAG: hypothetical protein IPK18_04210 [Sphingobacteriales bacterium]|nr:MAG: hypothetical protein IPK18_04210 [Sphingobacteriales bacterium]